MLGYCYFCKCTHSIIHNRQKGGYFYGTKRTFGLPSGLYPALRRLRHRLRQRMEVPVDVRQVRRRRLPAHLPYLPRDTRTASNDNGIRAGPRRSGEPRKNVPKARKAGTEVAHTRLCRPHRQHIADGLLYRSYRLDDLLLCDVPQRQQRKPGLRIHDNQPRRKRPVHGHRRGVRLRHTLL